VPLLLMSPAGLTWAGLLLIVLQSKVQAQCCGLTSTGAAACRHLLPGMERSCLGEGSRYLLVMCCRSESGMRFVGLIPAQHSVHMKGCTAAQVLVS
jgi:hypothetical protein